MTLLYFGNMGGTNIRTITKTDIFDQVHHANRREPAVTFPGTSGVQERGQQIKPHHLQKDNINVPLPVRQITPPTWKLQTVIKDLCFTLRGTIGNPTSEMRNSYFTVVITPERRFPQQH